MGIRSGFAKVVDFFYREALITQHRWYYKFTNQPSWSRAKLRKVSTPLLAEMVDDIHPVMHQDQDYQ